MLEERMAEIVRHFQEWEEIELLEVAFRFNVRAALHAWFVEFECRGLIWSRILVDPPERIPAERVGFMLVETAKHEMEKADA